jgi:hypothetical protein
LLGSDVGSVKFNQAHAGLTNVPEGICMREFLTIALFLIAYLVLTQWLLPKLGVPT